MATDPIPQAFICPITQDVLVDPVSTADGQTYSRAAIERWLASHRTSPVSNEVLAHRNVTPNHALRNAIEEWREQRPMAIDGAAVDLLSAGGGVGLELLGEGSFGRVVAGTLASGSGRPPLRVALKMLPAMTRDDERRAFERELKAHMHAARQCDGVCVLHGTCEKVVDGTPRTCIVMKRYERSLAEVIRQAGGPLDEAIVRRYGCTLFRTLRQLHEVELVVQDIKPDNILVDSHDELVIADFGLAEVMRTRTRIMPSSVRGTVNYMAPEAIDPVRLDGIGPAADVWSMGCVMVEMLTGVAPWLGMQWQQIAMAVTEHRRAPDVPEGAPEAALLRRCFSHNPAGRPEAKQMEQALRVVPPAVGGGGEAAAAAARAEAEAEAAKARVAVEAFAAARAANESAEAARELAEAAKASAETEAMRAARVAETETERSERAARDADAARAAAEAEAAKARVAVEALAAARAANESAEAAKASAETGLAVERAARLAAEKEVVAERAARVAAQMVNRAASTSAPAPAAIERRARVTPTASVSNAHEDRAQPSCMEWMWCVCCCPLTGRCVEEDPSCCAKTAEWCDSNGCKACMFCVCCCPLTGRCAEEDSSCCAKTAEWCGSEKGKACMWCVCCCPLTGRCVEEDPSCWPRRPSGATRKRARRACFASAAVRSPVVARPTVRLSIAVCRRRTNIVFRSARTSAFARSSSAL